MSTSATPPTDTSKCDHPDCETTYQPQDGIAGHCSQDCATRHRGQRLLNLIKENHKYCYTCFSRLKDVTEPSDDWRHRKGTSFEIAIDQGAEFTRGPNGTPVLDASSCRYRKATSVDAVTGYQYRTKNGEVGQVSRESAVNPYEDLVKMGTVCRCGATNHQNREDVIRDADLAAVTRQLYETLERFRREGQHDKVIRIEPLTRALRDQLDEDGWDFALAVGRAVED